MKKILFMVLAFNAFMVSSIQANDFQEIDLYSNISKLFHFRAVKGDYDQTVNHYLVRAKLNRGIADDYLNQADCMANLIPEIDGKQKLRTLITSAVMSTQIPDVKYKLLGIGLALLSEIAGDLGIGYYENFFEIRKALAMSATYLEASSYYYRLALAAPIYTQVWTDNLYKYGGYLENVAHYMILLDMLTLTINSKTEGKAISTYITCIREKILSEFVEHGKIISVHSYDVETLKENLPEIMAECHEVDKPLCKEIDRILKEINWYLRCCEKELGLR